MTLNEALAVKARGLKGTDYRALAWGRGEQPSRRHSHNRAGLEGKAVGPGRKNREAIQKYRHSPIRPAVRRRLPQRTEPRGQNSNLSFARQRSVARCRPSQLSVRWQCVRAVLRPGAPGAQAVLEIIGCPISWAPDLMPWGQAGSSSSSKQACAWG